MGGGWRSQSRDAVLAGSSLPELPEGSRAEGSSPPGMSANASPSLQNPAFSKSEATSFPFISFIHTIGTTEKRQTVTFCPLVTDSEPWWEWGWGLPLDPLFARRSSSEIEDDLCPGGEIRKPVKSPLRKNQALPVSTFLLLTETDPLKCYKNHLKHVATNYLLYVSIFFVAFCLLPSLPPFLFGCTHSKQKFPAEGSNLSHSSDHTKSLIARPPPENSIFLCVYLFIFAF